MTNEDFTFVLERLEIGKLYSMNSITFSKFRQVVKNDSGSVTVNTVFDQFVKDKVLSQVTSTPEYLVNEEMYNHLIKKYGVKRSKKQDKNTDLYKKIGNKNWKYYYT